MSDLGPTRTSAPDSKIHLDYRAVFEAAPDGIIIVDDRGVIVEVNPRAQTMFGYSSEALVGQAVEILVPEAHRGSHTGHRNGFHGNPKTRPMGAGLVLSGRRKNGSAFPVEISLSPFWRLSER